MKDKNMKLAMKIDALGVKDLKEVNQALKAFESENRITKTEAVQLKEGFNKLRGWLK